ncbi:hypothetical protein [Erwinia pyrifoliae]|uniref:hypothetical protein n=1 Tax=Erwinia pyrifoliae TaxID=79967 RepID=UPI00220A2CFE|nr:hypothetical protein [Erwinia pyrifoliae]UWS28281.1 hypothetical protein NYP81_09900 [Erwinia pyrifoliae]UWS28291.1 hypothetical protein NYP81_09950 [Erwinia pyrifoliae]
MIDINEEISKISDARFFSKMGFYDIHEDYVILVGDVRKVFIEPSDIDFKGLYKKTEWLPTSPTQDDPFYKKQQNPKDIIELRKEISKHVMHATKEMNKDAFISSPHDFSIAARNAICFAFRQLITERYFGLGDKWKIIVDLYYAGHWPVGYAKDKIIVI